MEDITGATSKITFTQTPAQRAESLNGEIEGLRNKYKAILESNQPTQIVAQEVARFMQDLNLVQTALADEIAFYETHGQDKEQLLLLTGINESMVEMKEVAGGAFLNYAALNELESKLKEEPNEENKVLIQRAITHLRNYGANIVANDKLADFMNVLNQLADKKLIGGTDKTYLLMNNINLKFSTKVTQEEFKTFFHHINQFKNCVFRPAEKYTPVGEIAAERPEYGVFTALVQFVKNKTDNKEGPYRVTYNECVELKRTCAECNFDVSNIVDQKNFEHYGKEINNTLEKWIKLSSAQ
jgi:hypothetical protein